MPLISAAAGVEMLTNYSQTWPSRTPTSSAGSNPRGNTPGPEQGDPTVTASPSQDNGDIPVSTPLPVQETPFGNVIEDIPSYSTSTACGIPPTGTAIGLITLYSAPNSGTATIGKMNKFEVGIIIGRYAHQPWWLLHLANGLEGWALDQDLVIDGYISQVPVITSSELGDNGSFQNEGWIPTPNPYCTTSEINASATNTASSIVGNGIGNSPNAATATTNTRSVDDNTSGNPGPLSDNAKTITVPAGGRNQQEVGKPIQINWLLLIGILLVAIGVAMLVFQSIRSK